MKNKITVLIDTIYQFIERYIMKTRIQHLLLASALVVSAVKAQQNSIQNDRPRINVHGESVVNVKPDKIVISFGIETWDKSITTAKQQNNEILKKALSSFKECGVKDKDIQTDYLSIQPRWDDGYKRKDFIGYFVRNTVVVTLTDVAAIEGLVTKTLQAGVNYIHGIDFQTTEFKKYREQARELAIKAAKEKAEKMAAVLGQSVGNPIQIDESYTGSRRYHSSWWGYGSSPGMSQNVVQDIQTEQGELSETIALGKISIRANVGITFELTR